MNKTEINNTLNRLLEIDSNASDKQSYLDSLSEKYRQDSKNKKTELKIKILKKAEENAAIEYEKAVKEILEKEKFFDEETELIKKENFTHLSKALDDISSEIFELIIKENLNEHK